MKELLANSVVCCSCCRQEIHGARYSQGLLKTALLVHGSFYHFITESFNIFALVHELQNQEMREQPLHNYLLLHTLVRHLFSRRIYRMYRMYRNMNQEKLFGGQKLKGPQSTF